MELKIKLLDEKCKPIRGTKESAGLDLKARIDKPITIPPGETIKFPSGIIAEIPNGHFGGIYARSGLAIKQGIRISNGVGIIDSDYRSELIVALHNDSQCRVTIEPYQRIAQLIIQPYTKCTLKLVEEVNDTERGLGGLGSTGK